ncbi:MAG TPA: inositol monophosphatase family protein [Kiloniellales bacterium]|jgi:myo-inositol-1(or 4)-monophosphatase
MVTRSPLLNVMIRAADRAARGLKRDFGEVENLQVSRKGPADFVSAADLKAERILRDELHKARPDYAFLMEESGASAGKPESDRCWIVDPLDGTTNFLHGLPHFAISIGLTEGDQVIAGVVYDPAKEELFYAEKGGGAYLNDRRMRVSGRGRLEDALLATGIPFKGRGGEDRFAQELDQAMRHTAGVRRWGTASLDLAYVAAGRFDGFWERDLSPWDVAAGILLIREAGGYVTTIDGGPVRLDGCSFLAANDSIHGKLVSLFSGSQPGEIRPSGTRPSGAAA